MARQPTAAAGVRQTLVLEETLSRRAKDRAKYHDNPNRHRVKHANRRARAYGSPGILTVDDVQAVMAPGRCHYCGSTDRLGIDHVIPLHAGGPNTRHNIVVACRSCNSSKGREDRPRRWSRISDACLACSRTDRRHNGDGLCAPCYAHLKRPKVGQWRGQKLTIENVQQIRLRWGEGNTSKECLAKEFGVHVQTIKDILLSKTWKTDK